MLSEIICENDSLSLKCYLVDEVWYLFNLYFLYSDVEFF